jgi:hydroxyacylglutathione hydrolase
MRVEPRVEEKGYSDITSQGLMQKMKSKERFLLLDVRSREEYNEGHIKGAIFIPHVVIYCRSGRRSVTASKSLVKLGFGRVKNLLGGIEAWKKAGGKIVKEE